MKKTLSNSNTEVSGRDTKIFGREREIKLLNEIGDSKEPAIVVLYGRRRVGKTFLIETVFKSRNIIKFEGLERQSEDKQRRHFLYQLSNHAKTFSLSEVSGNTWISVFSALYEQIKKGTFGRGKITIFFEELQWMADYKTGMIAELKYAWDNQFQKIPGLVLVLCGSSPSFMINHVMHSRSLYNRSQYEFPIEPFSLQETNQFLGSKFNKRDVLDIYLTIGGIPEYLKKIRNSSSLYLGLCDHSFKPGAFFLKEKERIFVSSLKANPYYEKIIEFLAKQRFATREEILNKIKLKSGKNITEILNDLELSKLIQSYTPFQAKDTSLLKRYEIADPYLQFYFAIIAPKMQLIEKGEYVENTTRALTYSRLDQWLGYGFERYCRRFSFKFARLLGFSAVDYTTGPFFNRNTSKDQPGFQIDLIFKRADKVLTVCEVKYTRTPINKKDAIEYLKNIELLKRSVGDKYSIEQVLITAAGVTKEARYGYWDRVIELNELFEF